MNEQWATDNINELRRAVASLNDIVAELAIGLADNPHMPPSREWRDLVLEELRARSADIGFKLNV